MKFQITMKDPDSIYESVRNAINISRPNELTDEEWGVVFAIRENSMNKILQKWISYNECITIEIDTVLNTATVVEA
jgi:sarcosine oxidase delta subunit